MARRVLAVFLLISLSVVVPAWAWTATILWQPVPNATGYRVEKSVDVGSTWTLVASPTATNYVYTGAEPGLVLFRIGACKGTSCTTRTGDVVGHNEAWTPPAPPGSIGVQ